MLYSSAAGWPAMGCNPMLGLWTGQPCIEYESHCRLTGQLCIVVTDSILSVTLFYKYIITHAYRSIHIYISRDLLLPVYMYLLYLLNGTATAWMKSSVFIHLTQLPSNPILFGFGRLALRCDFSKTKIQPLNTFFNPNIDTIYRYPIILPIPELIH